MNRGPVGGRTTKDHVQSVMAAWGEDAPDWVITLAEQCNKTTQSAVAKALQYSPATISQVLSGSYRGDLDRLEEMVRGAYLAETVNCPVIGEIGRDVCLSWQKKPYAATSAHRVQMFRACRSGCLHSKLRTEGGHD